MQLTQKETGLLKDLKEEEKLCVDKYTRHASCAKDTQLQALFSRIAKVEQQHLDTIIKMQQGEIPTLNAGGSPSWPSFSPTYSTADSEDKKSDSYLCNDVLATEKHASHLYDT
ncbi:MAG: ferritin-like domain-containing protein, partial [Lachnospiraceae bacterium]|nr:ferritin-like domain-containing protein [Lachnospiraceae bacterium]